MADLASGDVPAQRRLPLTGVVNCRDLGGYATRDGRRVRWGRLYRSDQLAEVTPEDLAALDKLGLRTVVDLRAPSEREQKPNRRLLVPAVEHAIGFMPHNGDRLLSGARDGTLAADEIEDIVVDIYRRFVIEKTDVYRRLVDLILSRDALPLLYHCTSGRDRTGFATAVILTALGVPRSTIADDYDLSNVYRRDLTFQIGAEVDPALMAALTQSLPQYLAASFQAIDEHYGGDSGYLRNGLGLTDAELTALQALLLES